MAQVWWQKSHLFFIIAFRSQKFLPCCRWPILSLKIIGPGKPRQLQSFRNYKGFSIIFPKSHLSTAYVLRDRPSPSLFCWIIGDPYLNLPESLCDSGQQPITGGIGLHWSRVNSRLQTTIKWWFSNGYGYYQIPKQSQLVYLIHFDQLSMLIKSAENPSHFYHLSSFSNQACSACLTQIAR